MPLTRFPNGITANSTTANVYNAAAGDGSVDCLNLFVQGTSSSGTITATNVTATNITVTGLTATSITATNISVPSTGRLTIGTGTAASMIGERLYVPFTFTSATSTTYYASPFAGSIIDCWVTCDTTPRTCSAFTLYAGGSAAGTVAVASVALAYATAIGQQIQPTLSLQTAITATGFAIVVTTAGSAANFSGVFIVQRTV